MRVTPSRMARPDQRETVIQIHAVHYYTSPGVEDTTKSEYFTYDSLSCLSAAQTGTVNSISGTWSLVWGYDRFGNRLSQTLTGGNVSIGQPSFTVDPATNRITNSGYSYDAAGNMTYDATANLNYTFDQENRITGASGYGYIYDGTGNRVEKVTPPTNPTSGTLYWYMTPGIVAESDLSGTLKSEYVFFDGKRVARKDFPDNTVAYYFSDHLKIASIITDSAGNIKADSDYYPWGGELQFVANDSNHYKFTSKERDGETGLDYFGARYYSNRLGRFMTPDWSMLPVPIPYADLGDPQSFNLFSYVRNAPTTKFDTDGHQCKVHGTRFDCNYPSGDNLGNNYGPLYFGFAWGHHGFPGWSKLLRDTDAFKFFSRWRTGPLPNPDSNLYDQLHRQYNKEVEKVIEDYLKQSGKTEVKQLTKEEIKQLAQKIMDSRSPGIRTFFERLGASATSALEELINKIEINIVPPVPKILMQDIICQTGGCGGPSRG